MVPKSDGKNIPIDRINTRYAPLGEEIRAAVDRVVRSGRYDTGTETAAFERQVAEYCGTEHAIACASGADALLFSLIAAGVDTGMAVITSPLAHFSTAWAIMRLGATPVFFDIDPSTYHMDPGPAQAFIENKHPLNEILSLEKVQVQAIIAGHTYGQTADMSVLNYLGAEYDIPVIEAVGPGIGAQYHGVKAGNIGDLACFSFSADNNVSGYGKAGMITTSDAAMASKLRAMREQGGSRYHALAGMNSRLGEPEAAVLQVEMKYLDAWIDDRIRQAHTYNRLFKKAGLMGDYAIIDNLAANDESALNGRGLWSYRDKIFTPRNIYGDPESGGRHVYSRYVIRTGAYREIREALNEHGIGHAVYYPVPLHEEIFAFLYGYTMDDCPAACRCSSTTLGLPIYPGLTEDEQKTIVQVIEEVVTRVKGEQ